MSALLGTGTCAHCGAEDVAIADMRPTGSASSYAACKPACAQCCTMADCQETTGQYRREELATMLALAGGAP